MDKMTERERVKKHIHFEKTDKIPWQINCTSELARIYMDALRLKRESRIVLEKNVYEFNALDDFFGNHIAFLRNRAVNSLVEVKPGFWKDEWGVVWDRTIDKDIGNPICSILDDMKLENLRVPNPIDPDRYAHFGPIIQANPRR